MLQIKNLNKIVGQHLYCKWLPNTKDWWVKSIEEAGDTYIFELKNANSDARFGYAEIQLRREPYWFDGEIKYEMWAWNLENGKPEVKWFKQKDLETLRDGVLWVGYMLEKILPKMK